MGSCKFVVFGFARVQGGQIRVKFDDLHLCINQLAGLCNFNGINFTAPLVPDAYWGLMVACTDGRYWLLIILVTWVAVLHKLLIM